jgi:hypothetical protein
MPDNPRNKSNLQISPRKIRPLWQQNRGFRWNILHFFSCFFTSLGFIPPQAIASQGSASIQPLQKKSCRKTYGRFFVFSICATMEAMMNNDHANVRKFLSQETEKSRGALRPSAKRLINTVRGRFK